MAKGKQPARPAVPVHMSGAYLFELSDRDVESRWLVLAHTKEAALAWFVREADDTMSLDEARRRLDVYVVEAAVAE